MLNDFMVFLFRCVQDNFANHEKIGNRTHLRSSYLPIIGYINKKTLNLFKSRHFFIQRIALFYTGLSHNVKIPFTAKKSTFGHSDFSFD
jgi:hypothetical protein